MRRILPALLAIVLLVPLAPAAMAADTDTTGDRPSWVSSFLTRLFDGLHVGALLVDDDATTEDDDEDATTEDDDTAVEDDATAEGDDTTTDDDAPVGAVDDAATTENGEGAVEVDDAPRGEIVSLVARCAPVGPGLGGFFDQLRNHGAFTRAAAHGATVTIEDADYDLTTLAGAEEMCAALAEVDLPHPSERGRLQTDEDDGDDDTPATTGEEAADVDTTGVEELSGTQVWAVAALRQLREARGRDGAAGDRNATHDRRDAAHDRRDAARGGQETTRGRDDTGPPVRDDDGGSRGATGKGGPPADRDAGKARGPRS